jgi:quercetin dioxygenase-like cupin family protein
MFAVFRTAAVGAVLAGLLWPPATAAATPATGVSARILAQTRVGGTDYIVREITVQPGGSTGWHYHDGTLYAVVLSGTLTRTQADCTTTEVSPAGSTLVEASAHVHIGRNLGARPVVLMVLYVNPAGSPLAEDAANPGCGFQ